MRRFIEIALTRARSLNDRTRRVMTGGNARPYEKNVRGTPALRCDSRIMLGSRDRVISRMEISRGNRRFIKRLLNC